MIYLISVFIALTSSAIEAVSYQGYILSHLHIPSYFFYLVSILLALTYKHKLKLHKIFQLIGILVSFVYIVLVFLETATYPNFIFTHTHINLFPFQLFTALLWFHILILSKSNFAKSLLISSLIFVGIDGEGRTLAFMYKNLRDIARDPFATYSQKMTKAYPGFYPAMQAVVHLTPPDATVLIPPQGNPWEIEGNAAMVSYFLYPRHVKNLDPAKISELSTNTYLLIAKGSWPKTGDVDYGWPKVAVNASKIWEINPTLNTTTTFIKNYDPSTDKWDWGLIEVRHD